MEENNVIELEEWKPVVGYEGLYEVSNMGRVRSLDRKVALLNGEVRHYKGKILKQRITTQGRKMVALYKDRKKYYKTSHSLVAEAFIGERPESYHVCHINGDYTDNRLSNIQFDTVSQNSIDNYRYGSKSPRGKLSIEQVLEVRNLYTTGKYKQIELADKFNISPDNISRIINRKTFSWLNDDGTIDESTTSVS